MGEETNRMQRMEDLLYDLELELEEYRDICAPCLGNKEKADRLFDLMNARIEEIRNLI